MGLEIRGVCLVPRVWKLHDDNDDDDDDEGLGIATSMKLGMRDAETLE